MVTGMRGELRDGKAGGRAPAGLAGRAAPGPAGRKDRKLGWNLAWAVFAAGVGPADAAATGVAIEAAKSTATPANVAMIVFRIALHRRRRPVRKRLKRGAVTLLGLIPRVKGFLGARHGTNDPGGRHVELTVNPEAA